MRREWSLALQHRELGGRNSAELAKDVHLWEVVSEGLATAATQAMQAYLRVSLGVRSLPSSSVATPWAGPTAFSGSACPNQQ